MAQLRQDYSLYQEQDAEILAVTPHSVEMTNKYFKKHDLPFPGLSDRNHQAYDLFDVQSRLISMGQRPGLFVIDKSGMIRFAYIGFQQWEIPHNQEILELLIKLNSDQSLQKNN